MHDFDVSVSRRGPVGEHAADDAEQRVRHACRIAPRPVLRARVALVHDENPSLERPCTAKASVELDGHLVRAHVAASAITEAIDLLEARLRRRIDAAFERHESERAETGVPVAGEWRHGDLPTERPEFFPRPAEERRILRRKTFAPEPITPEEAAWQMELLDHDFHLFTDAPSGDEAVVWRRPEGVLGLQFLEPAAGGGAYVEPFLLEAAPGPTMSVEDAVEELNVADAPFVFFRGRESGRND